MISGWKVRKKKTENDCKVQSAPIFWIVFFILFNEYIIH